VRRRYPLPAKKKNLMKVKRCIEMYTDEVSVVTKGANGHQKFLMVKSDGDIGQIVEDLEKAVPAKDADSETKEKAQKARAKKYGIEILTSGSSLSYPANTPSTERLFGDPVNLKYPLAYEGETKPDATRTRNAIARFKQNYKAYTKKASQARVYERIVRAAMSAGIEVSYDPQDPVDSLLPGDLKTRLEKTDDSGSPETEPNSTGEAAASSDTVSFDWLTGVEQSLEKSGDDWLDVVSKVVEPVGDQDKKEDVGNGKETGLKDTPQREPVQKSDTFSSDKTADAVEAVRKEAAELRKASESKDAEIEKLKKSITKLEAGMARFSTSIGPPRSQKPGERDDASRSEDKLDSLSSSIDLSPEL
jgi:hypothetical protein